MLIQRTLARRGFVRFIALRGLLCLMLSGKWRGKVTQSRSCDYWEKCHGAKSINDRERQVVESHIESWKTTSGCSIHFHWGHIAQRHLLRRYKRLKTALKRGNKNITFSYNYQEATRGGMKIVKLTKQTDNWSGFKQHIAYRWSWRAQIRFPKSGQVAETADHNTEDLGNSSFQQIQTRDWLSTSK